MYFLHNTTMSVPHVLVGVLNVFPHQFAPDLYWIDINPFLSSMLQICFQLDVLFT